ncbi:MBL fold metallo-hydrolase RNA specificity domain-containing protein [Maricaulis sp. CAU 1757]
MTAEIRFLGAAGTVTGSKYLVRTDTTQWLVDCGMFQGERELRERNWLPFPVSPHSVDGVLLTHAHIDHSGYLPVLVREGFTGPVLASAATTDLCAILLRDSGYLHEREAELANRYGHTRHRPAKPLYTEREARDCLEQFEKVPFGESRTLAGGLSARFFRAGHILGAAIIELTLPDDRRIVFSGDLGRPNSETLPDPHAVEEADFLVVESTYGNRRHEDISASDRLARVINETVQRGGTVLVPAFAVGRTQTLLYLIHRLKKEGRIADVPVFLDSPMAINASELMCQHIGDQKLNPEECRLACSAATFTRDTDQSKALTLNPLPKVIISASGMATGGRILHHLKQYAPDRRNTLLFTGFQAAGTRGEKIVGGAREVRIHGNNVTIAAEVVQLDMLSAHADADEIIDWLGHFRQAPRLTFVTHGEPDASAALAERIRGTLGWTCQVPALDDRVALE